MKILIVSDTHGRESNLERALDETGPIDQMIHLGDVEGAEDYIRELTDVPVAMVAGNNDYYTDLPGELLLDLPGHRALLTHGHYYNVGRGPERLMEAAMERGADIAMFGHTHRPYLECGPELTVLNPGSLTLPRQEGHEPSYMIMEICRDGEVHYDIRYLKNRKKFF